MQISHLILRSYSISPLGEILGAEGGWIGQKHEREEERERERER